MIRHHLFFFLERERDTRKVSHSTGKMRCSHWVAPPPQHLMWRSGPIRWSTTHVQQGARECSCRCTRQQCCPPGSPCTLRPLSQNQRFWPRLGLCQKAQERRRFDRPPAPNLASEHHQTCTSPGDPPVLGRSSPSVWGAQERPGLCQEPAAHPRTGEVLQPRPRVCVRPELAAARPNQGPSPWRCWSSPALQPPGTLWLPPPPLWSLVLPASRPRTRSTMVAKGVQVVATSACVFRGRERQDECSKRPLFSACRPKIRAT